MVWVKPFEVPVIVTVVVPVRAVLVAVSVRVLLPPVVEVGLNVGVTPLGTPEAEKLTLPVKPLDRLMVIALEPLVP